MANPWDNDPIVGEAPAKAAPKAGPSPWDADPVASEDRNTAAGKLDTIVRGAADMFSVGLADEIAAGGDALFQPVFGTGNDGATLSERYDKNLAQQRGVDKADQAKRPGYRIAGQVAGAIALPSMGAKTMAGAAAEGAALGGAYGFGSGEGSAEDRAKSAGAGILVGGLAGGAVRGVANAVGNRAARSAIPSQEAIKATSQAAYKAADDAGMTISQPAIDGAISKLRSTAMGEGVDRTIHPRVTAALGRVEELAGKTPNLTELSNTRRVLAAAAKSIEPDERRIASMLIDDFDEYLEALKPGDIVAGNADIATKALSAARKEWSRFRKSEIITDMFERAKNSAGQYSVSGIENSLRVQFRQLANNPKRMRTFTAEEQKAIQKVARGDTIGNMMRFVGKFAVRGPVSGMPAGAALSAGMPGLGAGIALAGEAGRLGASMRTINAARAADEVIRSGGQTAADTFSLARLAGGPKNLQQIIDAENRVRLPLAGLGAATAERVRSQ